MRKHLTLVRRMSEASHRNDVLRGPKPRIHGGYGKVVRIAFIGRRFVQHFSELIQASAAIDSVRTAAA